MSTYPESIPETQEHFHSAQTKLKGSWMKEYYQDQAFKDSKEIFNGDMMECPSGQGACELDYCESSGDGAGCRDLDLCWNKTTRKTLDFERKNNE